MQDRLVKTIELFILPILSIPVKSYPISQLRALNGGYRGIMVNMEALLRDGFLQDSPLYLLPYLVLVGILTAAPVMKLYNIALVEKSMDARLGVILLSAHVLIVTLLFGTHWKGLLLLYLLFLIVLWLLSPLFGGLLDWLTIKRLSDRDIARYRYMLTIDPNDANALVGLANAYLERGKRDEAIAAYEKAKAIDPLHTGVVSSRLQRLVDSQIRRNIDKNGVRIVSQNKKLLNMDEKISMEYVDKDDGPVIPEL